MYGDGVVTAIINNCDACVYLGSMDLYTCENIVSLTGEVDDRMANDFVSQILFLSGEAKPVDIWRLLSTTS